MNLETIFFKLFFKILFGINYISSHILGFKKACSQLVYYCYKMLFILKIGIDNQRISLSHFKLSLVYSSCRFAFSSSTVNLQAFNS